MKLVWDGKHDECGKQRVPVPADLAVPLLATEVHDIGKPHRNSILHGDNKIALSSLLPQHQHSIDLIYIDPPFDAGLTFSSTVPIGEASTREVTAFRDSWGEGTGSYIHMLWERLVLMEQLLSKNGSIYVHVAPNRSHYVKLLMDEVFGRENFRSEIIWRRSNAHNKLTDQYGPIHDSILFYARGEFTFTPGTTPFTRGYIESRFKYRDARGIYQPNYLTGPRTRRGDSGKPWRGYNPTAVGRHWAIPSRLTDLLPRPVAGLTTQQILDALLAADLLVIPKKENGQPMYKQYLTEGVPYQDLWAYQPNTRGVLHGCDAAIDEDVKWLEQEAEKTGFATQKPEGLLERIIRTSSREGDLVADVFCGSGTTGAVAERLGRRWILCDEGRLALHTTRKRMLQCGASFNIIHLAGNPADASAAIKAELFTSAQNGTRLVDVRLQDFSPGLDHVDFWAVDFSGGSDNVFRLDWQSFRTRRSRELKLESDARFSPPDDWSGMVEVLVVDAAGEEWRTRLTMS